jgi:hypothetical protein
MQDNRRPLYTMISISTLYLTSKSSTPSLRTCAAMPLQALDGLSAAFYKSAWPWVADDVYTMVRDFYASGSLHIDINHTHIVLIPKKTQPLIPQDFRPIVYVMLFIKSLLNLWLTD